MSTSRNSSASVRNPYKQSSGNFNYSSECGSVRCNCNLPAPCQEAWKEATLDPGRRFFGCSQYKDPTRRCNFFKWADPSYTERAREVIKELKAKLNRKDEDVHNAWNLDEEVGLLRNELEVTTNMLNKSEKENMTLKKLLLCAIIVIMILALWK